MQLCKSKPCHDNRSGTICTCNRSLCKDMTATALQGATEGPFRHDCQKGAATYSIYDIQQRGKRRFQVQHKQTCKTLTTQKPCKTFRSYATRGNLPETQWLLPVNCRISYSFLSENKISPGRSGKSGNHKECPGIKPEH